MQVVILKGNAKGGFRNIADPLAKTLISKGFAKEANTPENEEPENKIQKRKYNKK